MLDHQTVCAHLPAFLRVQRAQCQAQLAFAASLFSLAASMGHAQAHQMLDTIQMTSAALPACVNQDLPPEKAPAPPPFYHDLPTDLHPGNSLSIEKYLLTLPNNAALIAATA